MKKQSEETPREAINVVAAVVKEGDKYLCMQRPRSRYLYISEHWEFPGGKVEKGESDHEALIREIKEETGLTVTATTYLFSYPNHYLYSGMDIPTLDFFFECQVEDTSVLHAADDAASCQWLPLHDIQPERFGLKSIRQGVIRYLKSRC